MSFAFSDEQRKRLLDALGRSDSGAFHLTEDIEDALSGYGQADLAAQSSSAAAAEIGLTDVLRSVQQLRKALYALPEQAQQLSALGRIGSEDGADLTRMAHAAGDDLERLGARLAGLSRREGVLGDGPCAMAERFVHAVGHAYRNRLNIKPSAEPQAAFRHFLAALFELVQKRHADLDELAHVLDTPRLARILGID